MTEITNIDEAPYVQDTSIRGGSWQYLDLSGDHLGVRVEILAPGATSSYHHYHTLEEEHVLVLEGSATLYLGDEAVPLESGDHMCFRAGNPVAHHIENTSGDPFQFLVFGERREGDVVFYPEGKVAMVKALDFKQFTYRERDDAD